MNRLASRACVVAVILAVGVSGCGGGDRAGKPMPGASVTPSSSPTATASASPAVAKALKALQASVADLRAVEVSGEVSGSPVAGRRHGFANLVTREFKVVLQIGKGRELEMIRQSDTAWTKAPSSYWVNLGYTKESARAARGKWVAAGAEEIKPLVDAMDPGIVVTALLELKASPDVELAPVESGALRGNRVLVFHQAGAVQRVVFSRGPNPVLRRIASTNGGSTTTIDFVSFPKNFRVHLPAVEDVLAPQ